MSARQSAEVAHGLRLIAAGVPLRTAAAQAGVSPSSLVRARERHALPPLKRGRPKQAAPAGD